MTTEDTGTTAPKRTPRQKLALTCLVCVIMAGVLIIAWGLYNKNQASTETADTALPLGGYTIEELSAPDDTSVTRADLAVHVTYPEGTDLTGATPAFVVATATDGTDETAHMLTNGETSCTLSLKEGQVYDVTLIAPVLSDKTTFQAPAQSVVTPEDVTIDVTATATSDESVADAYATSVKALDGKGDESVTYDAIDASVSMANQYLYLKDKS